MIMMKQEKSCGAVIFNHANVLLVRMRHGHWSFPKGHVEDNETETMTAIREAKEETDIDIEIIPGFREEIQYVVNQMSLKTVVFFCAKAINSVYQKQESEIMDIGWYSPSHAKALLTYESDRRVLERVIQFQKEIQP